MNGKAAARIVCAAAQAMDGKQSADLGCDRATGYEKESENRGYSRQADSGRGSREKTQAMPANGAHGQIEAMNGKLETKYRTESEAGGRAA